MNSLAELDLLSPREISNPYPSYKALRDHSPVCWSDRLQGWLVMRAKDVEWALADARFSANRTHLFVQHQLRGLDPAIAKDYLRLTSAMLVMKDGSAHERLRRQEDVVLNAVHVGNWLPAVEAILGGLLDQVETNHRMEFVADICEPLPSLLFAELFGIPTADRHKFREWTDDATAFVGVKPGNVEETARRANAGVKCLEGYISELVAKRRVEPGGDIISLLINSEAQGLLTREELVANCMHMMIVGYATLPAQLANGLYELLVHRPALEMLRAQPQLMYSATEETIRYSPALHFVHRIATEDVRVRDETIKRGQVAFFGLASANRDAEAVSEPDVFDITRAGDRHCGLGAGPHRCAGANLGPRILEIGYRLLFRRLPELRLAPDDSPQRKANGLVFRGFSRLALDY